MENEKEYYAFISYKREDERWAKWLQYKLEHYRFPTNLNGRTDLPKNIRPTFRDVTDINPGLLSEEINKALQNSQWLIIVCSPRSAQSPWVCKEAQTFIDLGRADHIVPFVIEGTPFSNNPTTECYPEALLNLTGSNELLAANLNEMGRDAAAIKVVSRMFGLKFDSLWQRHLRERKLKRFFIAICGMIVLIVASLVSIGWKNKNDILLENKARYIGEVASRLLEEGDSYLARLLALEVLPSEYGDFEYPYTAEAERALRMACYTDNTRLMLEGITQVRFVSINKIMAANYDAIYIIDALSGIIEDKIIPDWSTAEDGESRKRMIYCATYDTINNRVIFSEDSLVVVCNRYGSRDYELSGHEGTVNLVAVSPSGNLIASVSNEDKTIRIWESKSDNWNCIDTIIIREWGANLLYITFGNQDDEFLSCYDNHDGESEHACMIWHKGYRKWFCADTLLLDYDDGCVTKVSMNKDDNEIVTTSGGCLISWKKKAQNWVVSDTLLKIDDKFNWIGDGIISADGTTIAASLGSEIIIWEKTVDGDGWIKTDTMSGHGAWIPSLSFSTDGTMLTSASSKDNTVRVWDLHKDKYVNSYHRSEIGGSWVNRFSINSINNSFLYFHPYGNSLLVNRIENDSIIPDTVLSVPCRFESAQFSRSGEYIGTITRDSSIYILRYNKSAGKWGVDTSIKESGVLKQCIFFDEKDNRFLVVSDVSIEIFRYSKRKKKWIKDDYIYLGHKINNVAISGNNKIMAIASPDCQIIYKRFRKKWKYLYSINNGALSVHLNRQGTILLSSHNKAVIIGELQKKEYRLINKIDSYNNNEKIEASFSDDGKYVTTLSTCGTVMVMKIPQGYYVMQYKGIFSGSIISFNTIGDKILILDPIFGEYDIIEFPSLQSLIDNTNDRFRNRKINEEERKRYYID